MLDLTNKGPVVLLTAYQTPAAIRRMGVRRLETWLRNRKVEGAGTLAARAVEAAQAQMTALRGEDLGAELVARLAHAVVAHNDEMAELDARIEARSRQHRDAEIILSMPGMGPTTGAEFIAATGGDLSAFASPDLLAGFAGLAPVPWDSGKVSGNLRRPAATTAASNAPYSSPLRSACTSAPSPRRITTGRGRRAKGTRKPSSPSPAAGSTSSGP
ncbi:transposase [Streptomyces sp. WAC06128]|uniref:transposase n=1 Tax=Streptomyces sp. WAC06128 TaxID=2487426 RepID=UPI000FA5D091|nr:IS110 family transposase [Streptomyces sp. WAC06128]